MLPASQEGPSPLLSAVSSTLRVRIGKHCLQFSLPFLHLLPSSFPFQSRPFPFFYAWPAGPGSIPLAALLRQLDCSLRAVKSGSEQNITGGEDTRAAKQEEKEDPEILNQLCFLFIEGLTLGRKTVMSC